MSDFVPSLWCCAAHMTLTEGVRRLIHTNFSPFQDGGVEQRDLLASQSYN